MKPQKRKRRRKVPRSIAQKTDREIMEAVFPKRVMQEVDRVVAEHREKGRNASVSGS